MQILLDGYSEIKIQKNDGTIEKVKNWNEVEDVYRTILFLNKEDENNDREFM